MKTEQINVGSYTVNIAYDECAENPFESWDCEPPLLAYYDSGRHGFKAYNGAPKSWSEILNLLPEPECVETFLGKILLDKPTADEMAEWAGQGWRALAEEKLMSCHGSGPHGWQDAREWLETAAAILEYGGIPCHQTKSNGYCQGDSALVLAIATPEWAEKVGAPPETHQSQCENACDLYGFWAWGDVYGVESITDENGDEIEDASCWGFYGSDHEKSGLLDHARNAIECHERRNEKQAVHFSAALCSAE